MSAQHSYHPDSHEHGLADDCPRCAEHAAEPLVGLDSEMLASLRRRIRATLPPRSENERLAMDNLRRSIAEPEPEPMRSFRLNVNFEGERLGDEDSRQMELGEILRRVRDVVLRGDDVPGRGTVLDSNGNTVGRWEVR